MSCSKAIIKNTLDMSDMVLKKYLEDLSDSDLLVRPAEGMNHIAWQIGHLIGAEKMFTEMVKPGAGSPLPEGFDKQHSKEAAASDDPSGFLSKAEYLKLWDEQRAATKAAVDALSDAELETPATGRFAQMVPNNGGLLNFAGTHALMHVGQWVPVRRKLGKPVVI